MLARASPSNTVILKLRASTFLQNVRCPLCKKRLCTAQILCIIEIKCTRTGCGAIVRIEPLQGQKERRMRMRELTLLMTVT